MRQCSRKYGNIRLHYPAAQGKLLIRAGQFPELGFTRAKPGETRIANSIWRSVRLRIACVIINHHANHSSLPPPHQYPQKKIPDSIEPSENYLHIVSIRNAYIHCAMTGNQAATVRLCLRPFPRHVFPQLLYGARLGKHLCSLWICNLTELAPLPIGQTAIRCWFLEIFGKKIHEYHFNQHFHVIAPGRADFMGNNNINRLFVKHNHKGNLYVNHKNWSLPFGALSPCIKSFWNGKVRAHTAITPDASQQLRTSLRNSCIQSSFKNPGFSGICNPIPKLDNPGQRSVSMHDKS